MPDYLPRHWGDTNPLFHDLLSAFKAETVWRVLANASFEPDAGLICKNWPHLKPR